MTNTDPSLSHQPETSSGARVLLFGTFDPLHEGHRNLFSQAASLGGHLTVVVARDDSILFQKGRRASIAQDDRLRAVLEDSSVDDAFLGDSNPSSYTTLLRIPCDILAVGYDQQPSNEEVRSILDGLGLSSVKVVRLQPYRPEVYKSSLLRT